jgi:excisionase family DNA binding protein
VTPAVAGWQNPAASRLGSRDVPELLTQQQLAEELQVSVRTLERWRREGAGPPWVRVGRSPRYRRDDVDHWLEATRRDGRQGE